MPMVHAIECVPDPLTLGCHHDNTQTNKPVRRDGKVWALSAHYIILIRPTQALPLARIYCQLFTLKYSLSLSGSYQEKENIPYDFCSYSHIHITIYFGRYKWSKLAQLHRTKQ